MRASYVVVSYVLSWKRKCSNGGERGVQVLACSEARETSTSVMEGQSVKDMGCDASDETMELGEDVLTDDSEKLVQAEEKITRFGGQDDTMKDVMEQGGPS